MNKKFYCLFASFLFFLFLTIPVFAEETGGKVQIGKDILIPENLTVHGDSVAIFANQYIAGCVDSSVVTIFGDVEISGKIDGDLVVILGDVTLQEGAEISGDLINILGTIKRFGENRVLGESIAIDLGRIGKEIFNSRNFNYVKFRPWFSDTTKIGSVIFSTLITLLLAYFWTSNLKAIGAVIKHDPLSIGLKGLIAYAAFLGSSALLVLTVFGIPLAFILILIAAVANMLGMAAINLWVGEKLAVQFNWETTSIINAIIGSSITGVVCLLPLGTFIKLILTFLALGGVIVTKFGTRQPEIS